MKIKYSFKQWCLDNGYDRILELWDYDLNKIDPSEVSFSSTKSYFFKCDNGIHKSRNIILNNFIKSKLKDSNCICKECLSLGQFILDNYGEKYLKKIWSDKNVLTAFEISRNSHKKIWIKCLNDNTHPDYEIFASNFLKTHGCPYCSGRKVCYTNSLGYKHPEVLKIWSDKNTKTPYEYTSHSKQEVWWKCPNGIHEDYRRKIDNSTTYNFRCHFCVEETVDRKENLIGEKFNKLTVVAFDKDKSQNKDGTYWICDCDCGTKGKSILASHLKSGAVQSCGCYWLSRITGENNYAWKGGITSERNKIRGGYQHREWAKNIYKKCFYTCQCCGKSKKIIKHAHHIINFAQNTKHRFDLDNGILLCSECHSHVYPGSFHNIYGTLNNTPEQLEEYINNKRKQLGINIPFSIEDYKSGNILKPENHKLAI